MRDCYARDSYIHIDLRDRQGDESSQGNMIGTIYNLMMVSAVGAKLVSDSVACQMDF